MKALDAFTAMVLWNWFPARIFKLPPLGFFSSYALLLTAYFFTQKGLEALQEYPASHEDQISLVAKDITATLIVLVMAVVLRLIIG